MTELVTGRRLDGQAILAKFPASIPRYTSYPTAPHFQKGEGKEIVMNGLVGVRAGEAVSLYVHVPYCDRLCWFCGCHTRHTLKYAPVETYLRSLREEISLYGQLIGSKARVAQLHLGGGSPSMVSRADFRLLRDCLNENFSLGPETEISIEIDPSDVTEDTLLGLQEFGITRASIGVQDFDVDVQKAINRPQSFEDTAGVVKRLRELGIHSLNIDALYGLPLQTNERLKATIEQVIALVPDRVALFGYAHVPWLKKHQQMIKESDLPGTAERFTQAEMAGDLLVGAGYRRIGMDHFARPGDSLEVAAATGKLYRNFQGYTTDSAKTLIGLGASAISRYASGFVQNIVATAQYEAAVARAELPVQAGLTLTAEDHLRSSVIERLMCDFRFDFEPLRARFGEAAEALIAEAKLIARNDEDGLCQADDTSFFVPEAAHPFIRIVASRFDAYLANSRFRFSRAI